MLLYLTVCSSNLKLTAKKPQFQRQRIRTKEEEKKDWNKSAENQRRKSVEYLGWIEFKRGEYLKQGNLFHGRCYSECHRRPLNHTLRPTADTEHESTTHTLYRVCTVAFLNSLRHRGLVRGVWLLLQKNVRRVDRDHLWSVFYSSQN